MNNAPRKNDVFSAKEYLRKAVELNPDSPDSLASLARIEFITGNRAETESLLKKALNLQPTHSLSNALWGTLKVLEGKFQEAIQFLERAIQIDPELGMAYLNLGIAKREIGLLEESESNIRKA